MEQKRKNGRAMGLVSAAAAAVGTKVKDYITPMMPKKCFRGFRESVTCTTQRFNIINIIIIQLMSLLSLSAAMKLNIPCEEERGPVRRRRRRHVIIIFHSPAVRPVPAKTIHRSQIWIKK